MGYRFHAAQKIAAAQKTPGPEVDLGYLTVVCLCRGKENVRVCVCVCQRESMETAFKTFHEKTDYI